MNSVIKKESNSIGSNRKIRNGAIFSYLTIVFEVVINFFVIRTLTKQLGDDYGIYTLALNVISIFLVDFGLSQAVTKFVSRFRVENNKEKESVFIGIIIKAYLFIDVCIATICITLFFFLDNIYAGLTVQQLEKFKVVYFIVAVYSCVSFPMLPLNGLLSAYEEFSAIKIMAAIQKALSALLMFIVILAGSNLYFAVLANVSSAFFVSVIKLIYVLKKCRIKPKFKNEYKGMLKSIITFTIWIAISSLATRLSISLMSTVLASVRDAASIAIFGIAVTIETYAYTFTNVFSGLFLPKITKMDFENNYDAIENNSFRVGKMQTCISGLILSGFVVFGKNFLNLYLEPMYSQSYWPTILLISTIFVQSPLVIQETVCIANGSLKQSAILELVVSFIRLALCFVFAKFYGVIGLSLCYAVLGIAMYFLKMIFVYKRYNKLNLKRFLIGIYVRSLAPIGISILLGLLISKIINPDTWPRLILLIIVFALFYFMICFSLFFNKNESETIVKKIIYKNMLFAKVYRYLKAKGKYGVPIVFVLIPSLFSMLCSNYPIDKVSFLFATMTFLISMFAYVYFLFPISATKNDKILFFKHISSISFLVAFGFAIVMFINLIVTKSYDNVFGYCRILLYILSGFFVSQTFSFEEFIKFFKAFFSIGCVISLFFYALINIFGLNFSLLMYNGKYYNYFYIFYVIASPSYLTKNCSVFWEPGIFSSIALFMFAIECLFVKTSFKKKLPFLFLYTLAIISSGSLAGLILLALSIPMLVSSLDFKKGKFYEAISILFSFFFLFSFLLFFTFPNLLIKIIPFIEKKGVSLYTRILSFRIDFEIFLNHPFIGCGGQYESLFKEIVSLNYQNIVDSSVSTTGYLAATFGIFGLLITALMIGGIAFIDNTTINIRQKIYLIVILLMIINKEPHLLSMISWILFFFIVKNIKFFKKDGDIETKFNENSISYVLFQRSHNKSNYEK